MNRNAHKEGFTLVEVLVAMFILVIGIISVMQMLPSSILQARMAAERSVGAQVARNVAGAIRAVDAEAITTEAIDDYDATLDPDVDEGFLNLDRVVNTSDDEHVPDRAVNPNHLYGYQTIVQPIGNSETSHLHRVVVVLDFADGRTESYVTFVSKL